MYGTHKPEKYGVDKIALLGLFIVALLAAYFISASRSAIVLSEPIKLSYTGLSVSIPAGNGWQGEKKWKYQKNAFILSSFFDSSSGSVTALTRCRYLLAATKTDPDTLFKEKASAIDGAIVKTGQTQTGRLTIDWAHIRKPKILFDTFLGTAQLPNDRQLNIEVYQTVGDTESAERVFKSVVENLKFKDNQLLEAGSEIVAEIKRKGLSSFLDSQFAKRTQNGVALDDHSREDFFLIKDVRKRTIGFTMDVLVDSGQDAQLNVQLAGLFYIRGRNAREQVTFFQSDNSFDEFTWKSETRGADGRSGTEIVVSSDGTMTVREFKKRVEEKNYQIGPAAVPEVFLEPIFSQLLDSYYEEILVDIIEADGSITPVLVSKVEAERGLAGEEAVYVLKMELLNGQGFSEQVYLDNQKRISKRLLRQKNIYTVERTSAENILRQFPEHSDYILRKNKMLKQNQDQY